MLGGPVGRGAVSVKGRTVGKGAWCGEPYSVEARTALRGLGTRQVAEAVVFLLCLVVAVGVCCCVTLVVSTRICVDLMSMVAALELTASTETRRVVLLMHRD